MHMPLIAAIILKMLKYLHAIVLFLAGKLKADPQL